APVAADARYTCSSSRPLSLLRNTAAVVSGPLAIVVVVVDSATLPSALAPPLLPQPAPSRPRASRTATDRSDRLCTRIIPGSLSRPRCLFTGRDTTRHPPPRPATNPP